jgi:ribosomal protein L17
MQPGYFSIPLWLLVLVISTLLGIIGYFWHRIDKWKDEVTKDMKTSEASNLLQDQKIDTSTSKITELERKSEMVLERGKPLTVEDHGKLCTGVSSALVDHISKIFDDKFAIRDKWLEDKFAALSDKIDYLNMRGFSRGDKGQTGRRGATGKSVEKLVKK